MWKDISSIDHVDLPERESECRSKFISPLTGLLIILAEEGIQFKDGVDEHHEQLTNCLLGTLS